VGQFWFDMAFIMLFAVLAGVAGLLWPKMLNDRIEAEAQQLQQAFPRIVLADFAKVLARPSRDMGLSGYVLPSLLFTGIVIVGSGLIVLDTNDPTLFDNYEILYGLVPPADRAREALRSFICVQAAFLGAFLWSLQHLLRRAQARDIAPATIYQICLYIIFGMVLAVFVNFASQDGSFGLAQLGMTQTLPVLGFFTGYFSVEMFERVTEWVFRKRRAVTPTEPPPPLPMIEGISYDTQVRLRELWLDDAYALANCNPVEVCLKTPFGLEACIDWVGQAQLLLKVKPDTARFLRSHGVRTILQLDTLLHTRDGDRSAFGRLIDGCTFATEDAALREALAALDVHGAATLEKDLSFRRLRQLCELLYPTGGGAVAPPSDADQRPPAPALAEPALAG